MVFLEMKEMIGDSSHYYNNEDLQYVFIKKKGGISQKKMELVIHAGFEPTLPRLKVECFTIKLMNHV